MSESVYSDALLTRVLEDVKTIAMVGASSNWNRPSFFAFQYLRTKGFTMIPINSRAGGEKICGETAYAQLKDVPTGIDMVNIFRPTSEAKGIVQEALQIQKEKEIQVIWMQLGVYDEQAATLAQNAGMTVVMNRCPKIEYSRLYGELCWNGFNSRIISSKPRRCIVRHPAHN